MNTKKRRIEIINMIQHSSSVQVSQLCNIFSVSSVTIRKDLAALEEEKLLIRTHGGARIANGDSFLNSITHTVSPEELTDHEKKQRIGKIGSQLVNNEDFIFIGPGYTCLEVAKHLKTKERLTIVTNNISAAIELSSIPEFKIITVPGDFTRRNGTYYVTGTSLINYFDNMFFDKIFLTVDGVSINRGFSVLDNTIAKIYQPLLKNSSEVIICSVASRFDRNSLSYLGPLTIANKVVTEQPVSEEYLSYFKSNQINFLCSPIE